MVNLLNKQKEIDQNSSTIKTYLFYFGRAGASAGGHGLGLLLVAEEGGDLEPVGDEEDGQGPQAARGQQEGACRPDVVVLGLRGEESHTIVLTNGREGHTRFHPMAIATYNVQHQ